MFFELTVNANKSVLALICGLQTEKREIKSSLKKVDLCDGQLTFEYYCRQQFEVWDRLSLEHR